jgi:glucuronoarabinoxylan endo-1,4-beta-xylanase
VYVSAYKNASTGDFVIVAINQSTSSITQKFVLNNSTAGTVTPWITDGTRDLILQGSVNVSWNSFSYSLPAKSVCSFVGTAAKITVTSPASGEDWVIGSTRTIGWTSSGITGNVKIELGRPEGCGYTWSSIIGSTSNDGTHSWTVLAPALSNCIIKVTSLNPSSLNPGVYDDSGAFDIVSTTTTSVRTTTTTTSIRPTTTTSVRPTTNTKTIAPLLSASPTSLTFTAEWGTTQLGYFQAGKHFVD